MSNIFGIFKKIEKKSDTGPVSFIIAGLGNPGKEYIRTRHNIGFAAIDSIADSRGVKIDRLKFHALCGEAELAGARVLLMKPETFMNNSGTAVAQAAAFYKIPPERVLVLHDEISFDPGLLRIRRSGSAGGHNGLKSIISCLGSDNFPRIKIGVGKKPSPDHDLAAWVLGRLPDSDAAAISNRFADIEQAAELIIAGKIEDAMCRFSK